MERFSYYVRNDTDEPHKYDNEEAEIKFYGDDMEIVEEYDEFYEINDTLPYYEDSDGSNHSDIEEDDDVDENSSVVSFSEEKIIDNDKNSGPLNRNSFFDEIQAMEKRSDLDDDSSGFITEFFIQKNDMLIRKAEIQKRITEAILFSQTMLFSHITRRYKIEIIEMIKSIPNIEFYNAKLLFSVLLFMKVSESDKPQYLSEWYSKYNPECHFGDFVKYFRYVKELDLD